MAIMDRYTNISINSVFSSEQGGFHAYHLPHRHRRRLSEVSDLQSLPGQFHHRRPGAAQTGTVAVAFRAEKGLETHADQENQTLSKRFCIKDIGFRIMSIKTVHALLDDIRLLGDGQYEIVEAVRSLVKSTIPSISEEVKYGGIIFSSGTSFCGVFAYKQHVSMEFGHGAGIADMLGFLEGNGKGRRHIKFRSVAEIKTKQLAVYLPLALAAAKNSD